MQAHRTGTLPRYTSMLQSPILSWLNHVLKADPVLLERAQTHAGKRIQVRIAPFPPLTFVIDASGYARAADAPEPHDLVVEVAPWAFRDEPAQTWSDRLTVTGDKDLADFVRDAMQSFDIEDELAKLIGDIPAHRIGNAARAAATTSADIALRMARNVSEYLAEEKGVLVSRAHLETFTGDVAALASRLNALDERIAQIERLTRAM
jgi:ubiquinone biosynthesis accessory factor UbiJ